MDSWEKFEENHLPQSKHFKADPICWKLVSSTMVMFRGFGESLG